MIGKEPSHVTINFPFLPKSMTESPHINHQSLIICQCWEMQSGLVLQKQHASACTYHTVKSHPVPCGHVTFKNATVNDSTVHDGSLKESEKIPYTLHYYQPFFNAMRSTHPFVQLHVNLQSLVSVFFSVCF